MLASLLLAHALPAAAQGAVSDAVKRGEYVFNAADCLGCHTDTKNKGAPLAGGRALETPFGVFYSPNITPDPETGIGNWSEADLRRALRAGVAPDGTHLYPAFPFPSFTGMTDRDIADLYAYLKTREPVKRRNTPHRLRFPFGWRLLMVPWDLLFLDQGPFEPVAGKSAEWNRGNYLVNAIAHCSECHTPRNFLGALEKDRAFSGVRGGPDGQDAPNITPDRQTGIGNWTVADIVTLLKDGQTPDFDFVGSGMAEVVRNSTSKLTDSDRHAIAAYLKALPPRPGPAKKK